MNLKTALLAVAAAAALLGAAIIGVPSTVTSSAGADRVHRAARPAEQRSRLTTAPRRLAA